MTALVLVVDDRPTNVLLLETKLAGEYYDVITARDGYEAVQITKERNPDLVLLDVMMPGIDGFEVCRRLKSTPETAHIPVMMVTALSSRSDRLRGLDAGAEDFLTKPFNDVSFFVRTKALVRSKLMLEELRLRDEVRAAFGSAKQHMNLATISVAEASILLVNDKEEQNVVIAGKLSELYQVQQALSHQEALEKIARHSFDTILIHTQMESGKEGLSLAAQLKSREETRQTPLIIMINESRTGSMLNALELGIDDYLLLPFDSGEMMARVKTQVRRKRYQDALNADADIYNDQIRDRVTGLHNQPFLEKYLNLRVKMAQKHRKSLSLLALGIDCHAPETHIFGEKLQVSLAHLIKSSIRFSDLAVHLESGKFVVLVPETNLLAASIVAERICKNVASAAIPVDDTVASLSATISIGVAQLEAEENGQRMLQRALFAMEKARKYGSNQVQLAASD